MSFGVPVCYCLRLFFCLLDLMFLLFPVQQVVQPALAANVKAVTKAVEANSQVGVPDDGVTGFCVPYGLRL